MRSVRCLTTSSLRTLLNFLLDPLPVSFSLPYNGNPSPVSTYRSLVPVGLEVRIVVTVWFSPRLYPSSSAPFYFFLLQ